MLTRNPDAFAKREPELAAAPGFRFVRGDVLHMAAERRALRFRAARRDRRQRGPQRQQSAEDVRHDRRRHTPRARFRGRVQGRALLLLLLGAVYGAQPWELTHVPKSYVGRARPDDHRSAYGEGKRAAEMLCTIYARQHGLDVINARIFALLGPLAVARHPLRRGQFHPRRDGAARRSLIEGAGKAVRSYLYAADLTAWLWTMLLRAPAGAIYNVGSEEDRVDRRACRARRAAARGAGRRDPRARGPGLEPGPLRAIDTQKIRNELGVAPTVGLDEAIVRTARWNGWSE